MLQFLAEETAADGGVIYGGEGFSAAPNLRCESPIPLVAFRTLECTDSSTLTLETNNVY